MILMIRGHIRNGFENDNFYNLIKNISNEFEVKIYIHTWNIFQNSLSWRRLAHDPNQVNKSVLSDYFRDLNPIIKNIIIDDDTKIQHVGSVEGCIGRTRCPVLGYKNMFYGMLKLSKNVFDNENKDEVAVQTRFDVLTNSFGIRAETILDFLRNPPVNDDRIKFISDVPFNGIDNIYMSTVENMYKYLQRMYFNLDWINEKHRETRHQEHLSFFERNIF